MDLDINQLIKDSNLPEADKKSMKFLAASLREEGLDDFIEKSFLFEGNPGIGKTYFVENFIKSLGLPILFLGPFSFDHKKQRNLKVLKNLL